MSLKNPYRPKGTCEFCKFSSPPKKGTTVAEYYPLLCHRVPPTPATSFSDIWSKEAAVGKDDYCAMFERDNK